MRSYFFLSAFFIGVLAQGETCPLSAPYPDVMFARGTCKIGAAQISAVTSVPVAGGVQCQITCAATRVDVDTPMICQGRNETTNNACIQSVSRTFSAILVVPSIAPAPTTATVDGKITTVIVAAPAPAANLCAVAYPVGQDCTSRLTASVPTTPSGYLGRCCLAEEDTSVGCIQYAIDHKQTGNTGRYQYRCTYSAETMQYLEGDKLELVDACKQAADKCGPGLARYANVNYVGTENDAFPTTPTTYIPPSLQGTPIPSPSN